MFRVVVVLFIVPTIISNFFRSSNYLYNSGYELWKLFIVGVGPFRSERRTAVGASSMYLFSSFFCLSNCVLMYFFNYLYVLCTPPVLWLYAFDCFAFLCPYHVSTFQSLLPVSEFSQQRMLQLICFKTAPILFPSNCYNLSINSYLIPYVFRPVLVLVPDFKS